MSATNGGGVEWRLGMLESRSIAEHNKLSEVMAEIREQRHSVEEIREGMGETLQRLIVIGNRLDALTEKFDQSTRSTLEDKPKRRKAI